VIWLRFFLTSAPDGGVCSISGPARFNPGKRIPVILEEAG